MLKPLSVVRVHLRQYSSALYITGDKAQTHYATLTPVVDFETHLKNKDVLIDNFKNRRLAIDLNKIEERWNFFKEVEARKNILEETRASIGHNLSGLSKLQGANAKINEEIEALKTHLKVVKEDLKELRSVGYRIEEAAVLQVLNLPNTLHPKTPKDEELEMYRYLERTELRSECHTKIGYEKNYLKLINHMSCYLKSDAALFEFSLNNYFSEELLNLSCTQFSNSDFVKSIVVEGCGTDPSANSDVLTLENIHCIKHDEINRLHLVGASSLYSFMAYFTKHFVQKSQFPIKAFCVGRKYQVANINQPPSLFNLNQTSEIGLFTATLDDSNMLENIINEIVTLYKPLGYHFRIVLVPAYELKKAESLRVSVQMFSGSLFSYVEVGSISFYHDYLSKRLIFNYNSEDKERRYPNVVAGNLINIHRVIGCVLENSAVEGKPLLNQFLSKYVL